MHCIKLEECQSHYVPFIHCRFSFFLCWNPAFRREGVLCFHYCQCFSMSVNRHVFSKSDHRIFLKLLMTLGHFKGKQVTASFLGKNLILGIMPKNTLKIVFFGFCKQKKVHRCVDSWVLNQAP